MNLRRGEGGGNEKGKGEKKERHIGKKKSRKKEAAKRKSSIYHLRCVECINSKICSEFSLSRCFHRGTSFIKTVHRSIQQTYTPCTVDKIISSLWIWLGSSVTWAIATLIWDDKSGEKKKKMESQKESRSMSGGEAGKSERAHLSNALSNR